MYKVYHRKQLYPGVITDDPDPLPAAKLDWPASYQEVAQVEATSLEEVYFKTQHLESPWWHNRGVKALQMSRSTSMGDVIQQSQVGVADPGRDTGSPVLGWYATRESQPVLERDSLPWNVAVQGPGATRDEQGPLWVVAITGFVRLSLQKEVPDP